MKSSAVQMSRCGAKLKCFDGFTPCCAGKFCQLSRMSLDVLMKEVGALDGAGRRRLMAYMVALEDRSNPGYREKLAQKIDDTTPGRWLTPEQIEQELGLNRGE